MADRGDGLGDIDGEELRPGDEKLELGGGDERTGACWNWRTGADSIRRTAGAETLRLMGAGDGDGEGVYCGVTGL